MWCPGAKVPRVVGVPRAFIVLLPESCRASGIRSEFIKPAAAVGPSPLFFVNDRNAPEPEVQLAQNREVSLVNHLRLFLTPNLVPYNASVPEY